MVRGAGYLVESGGSVHRALAWWAAGCAERALPLFTAAAPLDQRPSLAIAELRLWIRGERTVADCRQAALDAHAAARALRNHPAAVAAARAAGQAAAVAHVYEHCIHAAEYAARAASLAAPAAEAETAWQAERAWQWQRLDAHLRLLAFPRGERGSVLKRT